MWKKGKTLIVSLLRIMNQQVKVMMIVLKARKMKVVVKVKMR